jgi:hypothetical protein
MTMYFLSFISLLFAAGLQLLGPGQEATYPTADLSPALKENAHAVIRAHETTFTVKSTSSAVERVRYAVTILDESAESMNTLVVPYDKLNKVAYLKGSLYDQDGKEVKRLKQSEVQDMSMSTVANTGLLEDNRLKVAQLSHAQYPYTVEFEYEKVYKGLLFYPIWRPQPAANLSVATARFQVVLPSGMSFRHKEMNVVGKPQVSREEKNEVYTWQVSNLVAREPIPFQPPLAEISPTVFTAPDDFAFEGYQGNMTNWASFGKWISQLNTGRDQLPEATVAKLKALVADAPDEITRIQRLYQYLQANTRYVSIQLGIGGFQPFEASFVDSKGYGDCKALSNYMRAMLQAVGINAYYTLVRAGQNEPDIQVDFPSNQFNHVILCVPMAKDSLWLECTSQTQSLGYAGSFTGDRHALLITPEGGKLVRTPVYRAEANKQQRLAQVRLEATGNARVEVETTYSGRQQEEVSGLLELGTDEQKKWLYQQVKIPSFSIEKFQFENKKGRVPEVRENLALQVNKYASISGKRLFLSPNLMNQQSYIPPKVANRTLEVVRTYDYLDTDVIQYQLPAGTFQVEFLPEPQTINTIFGAYSCSVKLENEVITYTRSLRMNQGRFPAAAYPELLDFYRRISKADKMQVVLATK